MRSRAGSQVGVRRKDKPLRARVCLVVLLAYLGVAVLMTWPLIANVKDHLPGPSNDNLHHYWNGWWMRRALTTGQPLYHTPYLRYPDGISLVSHDIAWFTVVSWMVLEPVLGGLVAYNWTILISLALCGMAAFALAYELTGHVPSAFLAGLLYQNWPFRLYQPDHPNLVATQWIPFFLLFLVRTMDEGRWRDGLLTGVFLALAGYTRWQQLVPAVILGGIYFVVKAARKPAAWRQWTGPLLLGATAVCLALTPPALLLLRQQRTEPAALLRPGDEVSLQTDLLAYVTPSDSHPLWKDLTKTAYARYYPDRSEPRRFPAYIGLTAIVLVGLGLWHSDRRQSLPWGAMALTLTLLALGPVLRINGRLYPGVPMPYRLAARLGLVSVLRFPDRFNLFLALPVAMLAALGVGPVVAFARRRSLLGAKGTSLLLGGALLLEYLALPIPLLHPDVAPFFRQLAEDQSDFAVLNLPLGDRISKPFMFAQVTHQHPIVQGHVSRFPQGAFAYVESQAWIRALHNEGQLPPDRADVSGHLATLDQDGVRYVILHKDLIPGRMHHWRRYFATPPRYEDDEILVYPTSMASEQDFKSAEELAPGLGVLTATLSTPCVTPGQPLGIDIAWGASTPPGRDLTAKIELVAPSGATEQAVSSPLCSGWSTSEWPGDTVAWGHYVLGIPRPLATRTYTVTVALLDAATEAVAGRALDMGQVTVSEHRCSEFVPDDTIPVNAVFGNQLRLLGYKLRQDGDELGVALRWRGERLMSTDFKMSVELYDPDTGERLSRYDGMPRQWAHPTTHWRAGEVVLDTIPLSLEGLPADLYHLSLTVYDPDADERLPVIASSGRTQPARQLVLPERTTSAPQNVQAGTPVLPADWSDQNGPQVPHHDLLPELTLLGGHLKHQALPAGERIAVQLVWTSRDEMVQDYRLHLALVGENGTVYRARDVDITDIDYPTSQWQPGDMIQDWHYLSTPEEMPSGDATLLLNLVGEDGLPVLAEPVQIGTVWVQAVEPLFELPDTVDQQETIVVGDSIALLGHDLSPRAEAGKSVAVTLYWQAQEEMETSYKVFVHLYDNRGAIVAQKDRRPGLGIHPTTSWMQGEVVADRYYVHLPSDIPAGPYTVGVGLYDPQTGQRLTAVEASGGPLDENRVLIGAVEVER